MPAWTPLGDRAIRFARPRVSPRELIAALRAWPGVVDVVIGSDMVAAYFDRVPVVDELAIARLATLESDARDVSGPTGAPGSSGAGESGSSGARDAERRTITIRVVYDGVDLPTVAKLVGIEPLEYARLHQGTTFDVDMIGFLPGFAYLVGLPEHLHVPRRTTPSPKFPAGSLAVGAQYTGVYPFDSPGGWHVIGRVVDGPMWGPDGARIHYGDRVRFDGGLS